MASSKGKEWFSRLKEVEKGKDGPRKQKASSTNTTFVMTGRKETVTGKCYSNTNLKCSPSLMQPLEIAQRLKIGIVEYNVFIVYNLSLLI